MLLEFTVPGPPVSHQSRNKAKLNEWRRMVRSSAATAWGSRSLLESNLSLVVTYYHQGGAIRSDIDNMIKPIQDALIGLVYQDDRLITDLQVRKTSIDGFFQIRGCSLVLRAAFFRREEFLHIVIDKAPGHEIPLK